MKHYLNNITLSLAALFFVLFFAAGAVNVLSEEEPAEKAAPSMDHQHAESMAKWKEHALPGDAHKAMEPLTGNWDYVVSWWMTPDAEPQKSTGSSEVKWIMGGRFLEQTAKGTSMGQEFQGMGVMGYDNASKQYRGVWIDNMGTGIMTSTGSYDASTKTFEEKGSYTDPMEGEKSFRGVTTIVDADKYTYEMYIPGADSKEFRVMEIVYTRQKSPSPKD